MTLVAEFVSDDVATHSWRWDLQDRLCVYGTGCKGAALGKVPHPLPGLISQMNEMGFQLRRAAPAPPPPPSSWRSKAEHRQSARRTNKWTKGDGLSERKNRCVKGRGEAPQVSVPWGG